MRILLFGGSGFIGRNIVCLLPRFVDAEIISPSSKTVDLRDFRACVDYVKTAKPDFVINSAVSLSSPEDSLRFFFNVEAATRGICPVIWYGSGAEYGSRREKPRITESEFNGDVPSDSYGLVKYVAARAIEGTASHVANIRLFGVYGPFEDFKRRYISNNICRALAGLDLRTKSSAAFDYIFVADVIEATVSIIKNIRQVVGHAYNFCSGEAVPLNDIGVKIAEAMGVAPPRAPAVIEGGIGAVYSGDPARFIDKFGFGPRTSLNDGIYQLIEFHRETLSPAALAEFRQRELQSV